MAELLLYTTLSCTDSSALMVKIQANKDLPAIVKVELIETVKDSAPECDWFWDAND